MSTEAIFFFQGNRLVKEMFKSEFDALVSGVIQAEEFQNEKLLAVYAQINDNLLISGLLFFVVRFDMQGQIVVGNKLPIQQLMQDASRGPDLGAGAVRLVSQQQCNAPWFQQQLWEPPGEIYGLLIKAVKENRLAIKRDIDEWLDDESFSSFEDDHIPVLKTPASKKAVAETHIPTLQVASSSAKGNDESIAALKQELADIKAQMNARLDALKSERDEIKEKNAQLAGQFKQKTQEQLEEQKLRFAKELEQKEQSLSALAEQLSQEQQRYQELKQQQSDLAKQFEKEREAMTKRLEQGSSENVKQINELKLAFDRELAAKVENETTEVKQRLVKRDVELFYLTEQMGLLQDEIDLLKEDKQALIAGQSKDLLNSLEDNDVNLVFFQAGVGYIPLAYEEVGRFLGDKDQFIADHCELPLEELQAWQQHVEQATCGYVGGGQRCVEPVEKVELLADFIAGISDRCELHIIE